MSPLRIPRHCRSAIALTLLLSPAFVLQAQTSAEPVLGIAMGTNRRALGEFLGARGWKQVADSIADIGKPSLYSGAIGARPAEIIAMFGESGRLVNLAINIPAASAEELRAAYAETYAMLSRVRCATTVPPDYVAQLDSILRGIIPYLPPEGKVSVHNPLLANHTTLEPSTNTDWPSPTWTNRDVAIGTQLTAIRLARESRWPYQVSVWSSVAMMVQTAAICEDSRAAEDSVSRAALAERLAKRRAEGDAPAIDSVIVVASAGVTLRVDTVVVRGSSEDPLIGTEILLRARRSTVRYEAQLEEGYDSLTVMTGDTAAAAKGSIVVDGLSGILAKAQLMPRAETKRLYDILREGLVAKDAHKSFVDLECEIERLNMVYPKTAHKWISEASARAHNPEKDQKAMRRLDNALGGHMFSGCAEDSKLYRKRG
ncbi:MAG: hypothetical protein ABIT20_14010 [Gemmatimonadaceae bacterium]